jgi:ATPase family associated with various cellular activities (AAA)
MQLESLRTRYFKKLKHRQPPQFAVIAVEESGRLRACQVPLVALFPRDPDLELHYGSAFRAWHEQFVRRLKTPGSSVSVFRGDPGTGKTSYLRHLVHRLRRSHRFYYLPLSVYEVLAAPRAVEFWLRENDSYEDRIKVVIIEDAESLLMQRSSDNQERIADLLNISDGFLGELLKIHIICTMNAQIEKLDQALLRPGRLLTMREFKRLRRADAEKLAQAKGVTLPVRDDYSLAEIYAASRNESAQPPAQKALGFAASRAVG